MRDEPDLTPRRRRRPDAAGPRVAAREPGKRRQPRGRSSATGVGAQRAQSGRADAVRVSRERRGPRDDRRAAAAGRRLPQLLGGRQLGAQRRGRAQRAQGCAVASPDAPAPARAKSRVDGSGWKWGESPRFPAFAERASWAAQFERLTAVECYQIVSRADMLLRTTYGVLAGQIARWSPCDVCGYPTPVAIGKPPHVCAECRLTRGAAP